MSNFKVNVNSDSYKFLRKVLGYEPKYNRYTFCSWYRKVILTALKDIGTWVVLGAIVISIIWFAALVVGGVTVTATSLLAKILTLVGSFSWIVFFVLTLGRAFMSIGKSLSKSEMIDCVPSLNNLGIVKVIKTWYITKKEKYCPLVEFED